MSQAENIGVKLSSIYDFYDKGDYKKALIQLDNINLRELDKKIDKMEVNLLKGKVLTKMGRHSKSVDCINPIIEYFQAINNLEKLIDSNFVKVHALRRLGNAKEATEVLEDLDELIPLIEEIDQVIFRKYKSLNCYFKAEVLFHNSKFNQALEMFNKSLDFSRKFDDLNDLFVNLLFLGITNFYAGNNEQSTIYLNESLNVSKKKGNIYHIASAYFFLGYVDYHGGRFNESINYFLLGISFFEESGNLTDKLMAISFLKRAYIQKGEVKKAVNCQKKSF